MGVDGQRQGPAALPPGKTWCPMYRRLGGSQGQFGWVPKMLHPPGFETWTIQPVVSRYNDCTIPAHVNYRGENKNTYQCVLTRSLPVVWQKNTPEWFPLCREQSASSKFSLILVLLHYSYKLLFVYQISHWFDKWFYRRGTFCTCEHTTLNIAVMNRD